MYPFSGIHYKKLWLASRLGAGPRLADWRPAATDDEASGGGETERVRLSELSGTTTKLAI